MSRALCLLLCLLAFGARADTPLDFPGPATLSGERREALGSYALPTGPWSDGQLPTRTVEGPLLQTAWRVDLPGATSLELFDPLRTQIGAQGWRVVFECETDGCGGFDFRYSTEVLPEPDMHVDLGDFRFLSAERSGPTGPEALTLLVSRSARSGFVQVTQVGGAAFTPPAATAVLPESAALDVDAALATRTYALDDLVFDSGSARLDDGEFPSLMRLADWLKANRGARIVLVGHTDASGALAGNTALSRDRAASVRARLVEAFGIPAAQVEAEGVGYLVPRATNATEEGRAQNRRVEAMRLPD
jgi:outer membrane protein OmpA-like peptidoglycan-associated protein